MRGRVLNWDCLHAKQALYIWIYPSGLKDVFKYYSMEISLTVWFNKNLFFGIGVGMIALTFFYNHVAPGEH